jgi:hypothetical protein
LNAKYANDKDISAYIPHGWNPQWKKVVERAEVTVSPLWKIGGRYLLWYKGSPTDQNINPMPIPAEINMEYHAKFENSGLISLPPSLIFPNLENARNKHIIMNKQDDKINNQSKFVIIVAFSLEKTVLAYSKFVSAKPENAITISPERILTTGFISKPNLVKFLENNSFLCELSTLIDYLLMMLNDTEIN